jgi:endoglycosylceramidase
MKLMPPSLPFLQGLFLCLSLIGLAPLVLADECAPPEPNATTRSALFHADGTQFKDEQGRVVILRGMNVSGDAKVPPFYSVTAAQQLDPLPGWGVNTLRLLFTWEAFEPSPCQYDESYLQYYQQVVQWAAQRNLYVVVDFHQDAFSRFSVSGCGEGFPAWAVHSSIALRQPRNDASCESWGTKMLFDWSHHRSWHHFHRDSEGARSRYLAMVERVAQRMAQHDNVIGYDVINEPWGKNSELLSLYNDAGTAIRRQDPSALLFVPPHAFLSSGLVRNTMDKPSFTNFAYAPHYYDPIMITAKWWLGNSSAGPLNVMWQQAQDWHVPLFLGEFGAPASTVGGKAYIEQLYDWLDGAFASSAHWNYTPNWNADSKDGWNHEDLSITDDTGQLRDNFTVRPYPIATAGAPAVFEINDEGLQYSWYNQPQRGSTELFIPQGMIGEHSQIRLAGDEAAQCELQGNRLRCVSGVVGLVTLSIR